MLLANRQSLHRLWKELSFGSSPLPLPFSLARQSAASHDGRHPSPHPASTPVGHAAAPSPLSSSSSSSSSHSSSSGSESHSHSRTQSDQAWVRAAVTCGAMMLATFFTKAVEHKSSIFSRAEAQSAASPPALEEGGLHPSPAPPLGTFFTAPSLSHADAFPSYYELLREHRRGAADLPRLIAKAGEGEEQDAEQDDDEDDEDSLTLLEGLYAHLASFPSFSGHALGATGAAPPPRAGRGQPAGLLSLEQQREAGRYLSDLLLRFVCSKAEGLPRVEVFWNELKLLSPLEMLGYALEQAQGYLSPAAARPPAPGVMVEALLASDASLLERQGQQERALASKVAALLGREERRALLEVPGGVDARVFGEYCFERNCFLPLRLVRPAAGAASAGAPSNYYATLRSLLSTFSSTGDPRLQRILKRSISTLSAWVEISSREDFDGEQERRFRETLWDGMVAVIHEAVSTHDPQVSLDALGALASFSEVRDYAELLVANRGLELLKTVVIESIRHRSTAAQRLALLQEVARILANVACSQDTHLFIVGEGFLPLLKEWAASSESLLLQGHARRALANLSCPAPQPAQAQAQAADEGVATPASASASASAAAAPHYQDGVFLLSLPETHARADVDVVFVHGLLGRAFVTWRFDDSAQEAGPSTVLDEAPSPTGKCWPQELLAAEFPSARVIAVDYETVLSEWQSGPQRSAKNLQERSRELLDKLGAAQVGANGRPVVFVTHSMGGLLVKQMLLHTLEAGEGDQAQQHQQQQQAARQLADNTRGIVFFSTPHQGSWIAKYFERLRSVLWLSVEVVELTMGSKFLQDLNERFRQRFASDRTAIISIGETKETVMFRRGAAPRPQPQPQQQQQQQEVAVPASTSSSASASGLGTLSMMVVTPESSNPGYGEYHTVAKDHIHICKPTSPNDPVYSLVRNLVSRFAPSASASA